MTKLTYRIVTPRGLVLKKGIHTLAEAKSIAAAIGAYYEPEYTPIFEKELDNLIGKRD